MADNNNNMSTDIVRVGFIGASHIAHKTWTAIKAAGGFRVTLVGCRSSAKAQSFINECVQTLHLSQQDTPIVGSYEDVVQSHNVDVVYISIPVTQRNEWIRSCAAHGKHVVGEKPCASDCNELQGWIDALSQKRLLYMDGTMFSHGPTLQRILQQFPSICDLRHIYATLCFKGDDHFMQHDIRINPQLEPHGALGDVGWYCIRVILHLMKFQMPINVRGRVLQRHPKTHAIVAFSGELIFATNNDNSESSKDNDQHSQNMICGQFYCSFNTSNEEQLIISGTNFSLSVPNLTNPVTQNGAVATLFKQKGLFTLDGTSTDVNEMTNKLCVTEETGHCQETCMWRDVHQCLVKHMDSNSSSESRKNNNENSQNISNQQLRFVCKTEEMHRYAHMALATQRVMDMLLTSAQE